MEQPRRNASPAFYKIAAIVFYVIGGILIVVSIVRRDWVYGAFGGITLLNAFMTTLKLISIRETKK